MTCLTQISAWLTLNPITIMLIITTALQHKTQKDLQGKLELRSNLGKRTENSIYAHENSTKQRFKHIMFIQNDSQPW